ncbi:MAG: adenosylmethionine decarboxylase, partial [Gammaproteobacteria bacterium]
MTKKQDKLRLFGFNNLTKTLSFNIYDVCYARTKTGIQEYVDYIDEEYNSDRLTQILEDVASIIGANILNVAKQDYDPLGASVTLLISEEVPALEGVTNSESPGPTPETLVAHLDKSHLTVHTYPETHPTGGICTFRADIDVSTCGMISPLKALNFLIQSFESDIVILDYRVRGFTRDTSGTKHYIDHEINSIQNFIDEDTLELYKMIDVNIYQENLFHTKMMLKDFELNDYLFREDKGTLPPKEQADIEEMIQLEMEEIFN